MPVKFADGLEVLFLEGTAGEMGFEHGVVVKERIHASLEQFLRRSQEVFEVPYTFLRSEAPKCEPFMPPSFVEELRGLAEGSETSYEELLALNCMVDVDTVYSQQFMHCCNFIVGKPATKGELLLHGRNLDYPDGGILDRMCMVVVRKPESGATPTAGVSWVGFVGMLTGCSATKMTVAEVGTPCDDVSILGVPITCLLRDALEQTSSTEGFFKHVQAAPRTGGFNVAVSDGKTGDARAIEITSRLCESRKPRRGTLIVDSWCHCRGTSFNRLTHAAGALRYARMAELIEQNYGQIDVPVALNLLNDKLDIAFRTSAGRTYNSICNCHTVHSVLFLPADECLYVAHSHIPAPAGGYHKLDLADLW